ncbi:MAG TPA: single-stranded DNA-binding protein [Mycobacteriales bacterium]|nr:single-stranded DNA-binding protein [Mycobacteriales bacterium]
MESTARNEVLLVGRLAAEPVERELPSGDVLLTLRLVVDRPTSARSAGPRAASVDTIDCVGRTAALRRSALRWQRGDVLELQGALRRRFFRTPGGAGSRYEVEVARAKRVSRAA